RILLAEEVQPPLLSPVFPGRGPNPVRKREDRVRGHEDLHGRSLIGDASTADARRIWPVLRLVALRLVVLHDDRAARARVIEQPAVVGAQIRAPLVRAHAGDDDVVHREVAPGKVVALDVPELRAELLDRGGYLIADARDVA